jgi:aspartyl-tRNA(Asn)/glutamyl-tRNA(Gln) amidotransferase subunit A
LIQAAVGQAGLAWLMRQRNGVPAAPGLQSTAAAGAAMRATDLFDVLDRITGFRRDMAVFFEKTADVILTPAAAALPWPKAQAFPPEIDGVPVGPRGHAVFTAFANIAGLPGLALPCAPAANGMPVGFQLVGAAGTDAVLLALGAAYEEGRPWPFSWDRIATAAA